MRQNGISACQTDITGHCRNLCLYSFPADLNYQFITDAKWLLPNLMRKKCILGISQIKITINARFDLKKSCPYILYDILYFGDIYIANLMHLFLFVGLCTVNLSNLILFQKKGPHMIFFFLYQNFSFHLFLLIPHRLSYQHPLPLMESGIHLHCDLYTFPVCDAGISRCPVQFQGTDKMLPLQDPVSDSLHFLLPLSGKQNRLAVPMHRSMV